MKTLRNFSPLVAVILLYGCGTPLTTTSETADQIILRAEQTAQTARLSFDTFVHLERDNEALLKKLNPAIHDYANVIRRNGLNWVDSLRAATRTFEATRNSQNQATLNTWLTTVTAALTQTNQYIIQAKSAVGNPTP